MGKNKFKILCIVFFPLTILFLLSKILIKTIYISLLKIYINNITIDDIDSFDGFEFEKFIKLLFLCLGFNVKKTKNSHDFGADIIIYNKDISIAIQCKNYYKHNVGISAIQESFTSKNYYNTIYSAVITNSTFSKSAIILSNKTNTILWDRYELIKMLNSLKFSTKKIVYNFVYKKVNTII